MEAEILAGIKFCKFQKSKIVLKGFSFFVLKITAAVENYAVNISA